MKRSLTMEDVARAAGVSKMTVSLALRNHPRIPKKTTEKIRLLANSMGYRPNPLVSALMSKLSANKTLPQAASIAYVTSTLTTHAWMQSTTHKKFFLGAQSRAEALGYRLEIFNSAKDKISYERLADILWHRNIHGVVLAPIPFFVDSIPFDFSSFSVVALGFSIANMKCHRISSHHTHTVHLILHNLFERGYKKPGIFLNNRDNPKVDFGWLAGYDAYRRQNLSCPDIPPLLSETESKEEFFAWFHQWKPDSIITLNSNVVQWIKSLKLKIPKDVGVALLNVHREECNMSGAIQYCEIIGATAVDLIAEEMNHSNLGIPTHPKNIYIESEWFSGNSTR